jgi:hypothetical protein
MAREVGRGMFAVRSTVSFVLLLLGSAMLSGVSGASGRTVTDSKDGLAFTLPSHWQQIPLSGNDITGFLDIITKSDPSMKSALTTEVKQAATKGVRIFALGPIVQHFSPNINVIVERQSTGPSTPGFFDELGVQVKLTLTSAGLKHVTTSTAHWAKSKVVQATYSLQVASSSAPVEGLQLYVWHGGKIFIVTFS